MPRIFTYNEFSTGESSVQAYADKHSPVITCAPNAARNQKLKVNVRIGKTVAHPNTKEHYFNCIRLWNLETMLAEAHFSAGAFGSEPLQAEVDFYVVPKVSMRLTAQAYCTKHGLWESEEVFVKVTD